MSNEVYANGMEVACKAANGKTIAALPDVCLSPPSPPAGPIPIPYPNTAYASDTAEGSKTVQISGKEVMLKDKSYFKQSTGNEAATKSLGMGVVTHTIQGKVSFTSWSMDVKIESENAVRHLDLTLHNEMSLPANTPTWPYLDDAALDDPSHPCAGDKDKERKACEPLEQKTPKGKLKIEETQSKICQDSPDAKACRDARRCMLTPYRPDRCCTGESGHHLVEAHGFCESGDRGVPLPQFSEGTGRKPYSVDDAPCVCATSPNSNWEKEHGDMHCVQGVKENYAIMTASNRQPPRPPDYAWNYGEARNAGVDAHAATFPGQCNDKCIAAQLDAYHKGELQVADSTPLRTEKYGFGSKGVDQKARGVQLIKELAEKRIGAIVNSPFKFA